MVTQLVKTNRDPLATLGRRHAEACLSQLREVQEQHGGILTPNSVVDAARPPDAPLHPCFEWNDTIAAERFRQEQAKQLIRSVRVLFLPDEKRERSQPTRVHLGTNGGRALVASPVTVQASSGMSDQVRADFLRELDILHHRFGSVTELARLIQEMRQRVGAPTILVPQPAVVDVDTVRRQALCRTLVTRAIQGAGECTAVVVYQLVREASEPEHIEFAFEVVKDEIERLVRGGSVGVSHVGLERTYRWKKPQEGVVINGHVHEDTMAKTALVPTRDLLKEFDELHKQKLKSPAHLSNGKDAKLLADLYRRHGEVVRELMRMFFATDSEFVRGAGYTVGVFYSQVGKLLTLRAERAGQLPSRQPERRGRESVTEHNLRGLREDLL